MVIRSSCGPKKHDFAGIKRTEPMCKFDYSVFAGCFGKKNIRPSDIDFVVERRGKLLIGEFKAYSGGVSQGQAILLKALAAVPQITVFVAYGVPPGEIKKWESLGPKRAGIGIESLRRFMADWYKYADRGVDITGA